MTQTVNRKLTKLLLIVVLLAAAVFPAGAFAATGDIIAIDFDSTAKVELVVGQTPKQLKVLATVEGSSSKRDVTAAVVWTNTDSNAVRVNAGLLTPLNGGTATITATYGNAVTTIEVAVTHPFTKLDLEYSSSGKYKLGDAENTLSIKANATGGESVTAVKDVAEAAEWSSSDANVLTVSKGKLTLVGEGTATVTAKYKGLTDSFKAEVKLPYSSITIKQVKESTETVIKELEMLVGDDPLKLTAYTKASADSTEIIVPESAEWSSSNTAVATVKEGAITILATGKAVITVKYLGVSASVDVYVRTPFEVLILTPSEDQKMFMNEVIKGTAKARNAINDEGTYSQAATWSSSNQLIATVGTSTVDTSYKVITAKSVGTATIKAEYLGLSKEVKVTVFPSLEELVPDKTELELYTNDSLALPKVYGTKLDNSKLDMSDEMEWTSANEDVAVVKDGKIVADEPGTVTITGKLKSNEILSNESPIRTKTVELKITVKDKVLVLIGPEDAFGIVIGEEQPLPEVNAVMESGEEQDVSDEIVWTLSGSNAVIKQTAKGKMIKGLLKGSATLKGTYSNKTLSVPVKIEQKVVKLVVEPNALTMNIKGSKSIKVTGYFTNGKTATFSTAMNWESSNTEVATVKGSSVKAIAEGTSILSGSYQGIGVSIKITVVPKLTKLTISENRLALAPGAAQAVVVTALYDTGNTAVVTGSTVWTSSKPAVAKVSSTGVITAVAKGTASIKGKLGTKTVTVSVTVK